MHYFAYGSNMCTARLAARVPTLAPIGPGWLRGHRLYFHLRGGDGSGKCNVLPTGVNRDVVHGVLFTLDADRLHQLHAAEGPAYEFVYLDIASAQGMCSAATYRGRREWLDDALQPFAWYRDFVVGGAREHGLPADYVAMLDDTPVIRDADRERAAANREILARR